MKFLLTLFLCISSLFPLSVFAQSLQTTSSGLQTVSEPEIQYQKAKIAGIKKEYTNTVNGASNNFVTLELDILEGTYKDTRLVLDQNISVNTALAKELRQGATIIVQSQKTPGAPDQFFIADVYRLPMVLYAAIAFVIVAIFLTGKKGIGAMLGLVISVIVILGFIVPQILNGRDALEISILGSLIILLVTTYLAHGVSKATSIAIISTGISLIITYFLAQGFVYITHLSGLGNEDVYTLEMMPGSSINPRGLLLGGIIIGTLGALNDMTVTQVTTIFALWHENKKQTLRQLFTQGFAIGKQHILSLVNTLVLAYAGSALPIFVYLVLNPQKLPIWVIINSETMSEEIVRAIVGSMGLMIAVPIATFLAAYLATEKFVDKNIVAHKH